MTAARVSAFAALNEKPSHMRVLGLHGSRSARRPEKSSPPIPPAWHLPVKQEQESKHNPEDRVDLWRETRWNHLCPQPDVSSSVCVPVIPLFSQAGERTRSPLPTFRQGRAHSQELPGLVPSVERREHGLRAVQEETHSRVVGLRALVRQVVAVATGEVRPARPEVELVDPPATPHGGTQEPPLRT